MEENLDIKEELIGVEITNIHYLKIEADDIKSAFSVFKNKLEEKGIFVSEYTNIDNLIVVEEFRLDEIAKKFIQSTKDVKEPIVWGGLYAEAKDNTLHKKYSIDNITQKGTKKWETRYVLKGHDTGKRYDDSCTTKGDAVSMASENIANYKENLNIEVEKVLISHDPSVAIVKYIKDPSEHGNVYMFLCNVITFDEEGFNKLYEENVEFDEVTKQWSIKVETIFETNKRLNLR